MLTSFVRLTLILDPPKCTFESMRVCSGLRLTPLAWFRDLTGSLPVNDKRWSAVISVDGAAKTPRISSTSRASSSCEGTSEEGPHGGIPHDSREHRTGGGRDLQET